MQITEVIREANDASDIHFLLTAYIEAVRYCDPLHRLPGFITELPVAGLEDIWERAERMQGILVSPGGADSGIQSVLAEALAILTTAARRLEELREDRPSSLLEAA